MTHLLIHDDAESLEMIAESLGEMDIRLNAVDDRTQGLAKLSMTGYDLILLDGMSKTAISKPTLAA